ncbi:MAG: methylated-DNA--[protein]-cysteine S-methyltransferase [Bacteroidales bacterium]
MTEKTTIASPIGNIHIIGGSKGITYINFTTESISYYTPESLQNCVTQLQEYFAGQRKSFDIPLFLQGTPFQKTVWNVLQSIGYGEVTTYKQIAQKIFAPKAYRAVGNANNKNPILILIPCHRVIASNGSLCGYAAGNNRKKWLLDFEKNTTLNII